MANNTPIVPNLTCPVPITPSESYFNAQQSQLNVARKDKFLIVIDIPQILRPLLKKENRSCNGGNLERLQMNVWGYVVPELQVNKQEIQFGGQTMKFSGHSRPSMPDVSVNFTIDNRFDNYYILYKWLDIQNDDDLSQFDGKGMWDDSTGHLSDYATTLTVYALDEYEKPVAKWEYIGAFPTLLGSINASSRETAELESNFSFAFSKIKMSLV